jgi:TetR/AcrR family transcriptional regulator
MRRTHDADITREMLLRAATTAFAEHGFAGARVDDIAARAGVNKALIYAYYGDKEGLYRAVLSSRLAAPIPSLALGAEADARKALEDLVRRHFRLLLEDRAFARLLAWDLLSTGARGPDALVESAGPALDLVGELVRRTCAIGALRPSVDPDLFRTAVVALALGYSLQHPAMEAVRARSGARFTDAEFVEYACGLLLDDHGRGGGSASDRAR